MAQDLPPLVDVADIIRLVGATSFHRGQAYARDGAVQMFTWDDDAGVLTGMVQGNRPAPYRCRVQLALTGSGRSHPVDSSCTCPMDFDCKHVAATLLAGNTARVLNMADRHKQPVEVPHLETWQSALRTLAGPAGDSGAGPRGQAGVVPAGRHPNDPLRVKPLGLQFELQQRTPRVSERWRPPGIAQQAQPPAQSGHFRLGVRPVVFNSKGNWVKADLTWNNIGHRMNQMNLHPEQHRWFRQFAPLHRASGELYYGYDADWLYLDDFSSPLLWHLLDEAAQLGIQLMGSRKGVSVALGKRADVTLDASSGPSTSSSPPSASSSSGPNEPSSTGDLRLTVMVDVDGQLHPADYVGTIGNHGIYCAQSQGHAVITLAPTATALTEAQLALLRQETGLVVPAGDVNEFMEEFYPRLRRWIQLTSSDDSVQFPAIVPPTLVLTVTFAPKHTLRLTWDWEYRSSKESIRYPVRSVQDAAEVAEAMDAPGVRDLEAEAELWGRVEEVLQTESPDHPVPAAGPSLSLHGLEAAEFVDKTLPLIAALSGVHVDTTGKRPDYRELTDVPQLTISTVETDQRDWFDLGVMVRIEGRIIPFGPIFTALAKGQQKLLLIDGTYLSLNQPVFGRLHELIEEARALTEWETGLRISRYQTSLWDDFEELAEDTEQAQTWKTAVTGLRELDSVQRTPLPAGVRAELRPYQLDGFNWLAFLWQNQLGGILADDMGLGKTLQALALIAHANEQSTGPDAIRNREPFLVVAPTSVVSNWVSEAQRFTPSLVVRSITDTQKKSGKPLAETVAGADILITSYALFRLDFQAYQAGNWAGLILDEAQFVKNSTAQIHQCAKAFNAPFKLAITGTPMENNLMELWSLFSIVAPGLFAAAGRFTQDYQRPIERDGERQLLAKLRRRIRPLMLRRTKDLVAGDLPAKQEQVLEVDLAPKHKKIYETFLQRERQKLLGLIEDLDKNRFVVFRSLTLLRMLSLDASLVDDTYSNVPSSKLDALFKQLDDVVQEGHRALIFSQFTSFLKKAAARLEEHGIEYCYLDGSTRRRAEVIDRYKNGHAPVFLISLKAGGFGLNLTEADYVFLLDPWWNPAAEMQAVDRTHRIGQTKNVMVYRMVATGTIEEKVMALKERKAKLFNSVMDDDAAFSTALTAEDIRALLD